MIHDFHFLRPWWLVGLLVPIAIVWLSSRSTDLRARWKGMIAPHLLDSLVVAGGMGSRISPGWLLAALLAIATLGAAGPSWQREAPPFVEDTAPLVIAVDLSPTMDAIDVTPSRLERAKLKIKDVVSARAGARTAVIAYAGSAHLVLPLTDDADLIGIYVDALATRIMPLPGKDTTAALKLADDMLAKDGGSGTVLIATDGVEQSALASFKAENTNGLVVLGVGTAQGGPVKTPQGGFLSDSNGNRVFAKMDINAFKALRSETDAAVATITDDDTDIRWIGQQIRTNYARKQAKDGSRWRDGGWWLVLPTAFLFALSFRRGWVVRLGTILISFHVLIPTGAHAGGFEDIWLTPDQQGRLAFERNDFTTAAAEFQNPVWKGVALYRAGRFAEAVDSFAAVDTAESWYDQGNALLQLSRFEEAAAAYGKALDKRPDWADAKANLAIAALLLKRKKDAEEAGEKAPNQKPDQVQFDDKGKQGKETRIDIGEQTSELWMKNIQVSPADLMARKFAIEAKEKKP